MSDTYLTSDAWLINPVMGYHGATDMSFREIRLSSSLSPRLKVDLWDLADRLRPVAKRVNEVSLSDWSAIGGDSIRIGAANVALQVAHWLLRVGADQPFVSPTTDGGIRLEWEGVRGVVMIDAYPDSAQVYYQDVEQNREYEGPLEDAPHDLAYFVSQIDSPRHPFR